MKKKVEFTLPWPPSINNYYGRNKKKVYLKPQVRKYFEDCRWLIYKQLWDFGEISKKVITGKAKVLRDLYPPDKRKRDEDNIVKALNDTLMKSGLIKDDSQIVMATNIKHEPKKPGYVKITLEEI